MNISNTKQLSSFSPRLGNIFSCNKTTKKKNIHTSEYRQHKVVDLRF